MRSEQRNRAAAPGIILLVLLILPLSCNRRSEEEDAQEPVAANVEVEVVPVQRGEIRQRVQSSGVLQALPNQDVKVSALVPGRVTQLLAVEGDRVSVRQVIAKLDASTYEDQLKQAKATLENAQLNRDRLQKLYERGIAAGKEAEDAQKDFLVAQAAFDTVQTQLSRTEVRSPISGVMVKRFVNVGEQVDGTSNQPICEVANFDPIELIANLQASFLPYIKEGQQAEVKTDAFSASLFSGTVVSILPAMDAATNTATVRIRIPNPDHRLRGGMFATASVIAAVHREALYVPASAIVSTNNEPKIFVVGSGSLVEERRVKIGWRDDDKVEILENVKPGEMVVTTGSYGLADKMKVTVGNSRSAS